MPRLSFTDAFQLVDSVAMVLSQAYQLARVRLALAASPVLRLMMRRDQALGEVELLRRKLAILRAQREQMPPHRRPDYRPEQRLAILQLKRLRGWNVVTTAQRFVLHPNTLRSWIKAMEGGGNTKLFTGAIVWNRLDDAVRWAAKELRRLCPEPECGTRTIARHLVRAGIAMSRSTVQRVMREVKPARPPRRRRPAMPDPVGQEPDHLLTPTHNNQMWHMDLTQIRILWFRFTLAAILDGFSRKLLCLHLCCKTPRSAEMIRLIRRAEKEFDTPRFLITDHGTQFRNVFHAKLTDIGIHHVRSRVRTPYLNGKMERVFRTFRIWWRVVLVGVAPRGIQRNLNNYRGWYNTHRAHSALNGMTPQEVWEGTSLPEPLMFQAVDPDKPQIDIRRRHCRGNPWLPVIQISVRKAA